LEFHDFHPMPNLNSFLVPCHFCAFAKWNDIIMSFHFIFTKWNEMIGAKRALLDFHHPIYYSISLINLAVVLKSLQ
jgi:hypothetical protein